TPLLEPHPVLYASLADNMYILNIVFRVSPRRDIVRPSQRGRPLHPSRGFLHLQCHDGWNPDTVGEARPACRADCTRGPWPVPSSRYSARGGGPTAWPHSSR